MYVCVCRAVNEKTVRETIQQTGAETVDEVIMHCDCGNCCETCHDHIDILIKENNGR